MTPLLGFGQLGITTKPAAQVPVSGHGIPANSTISSSRPEPYRASGTGEVEGSAGPPSAYPPHPADRQDLAATPDIPALDGHARVHTGASAPAELRKDGMVSAGLPPLGIPN